MEGSSARSCEVVIIGAGFAGIGVAIRLSQAGLTDYLIVEEGDGFGGTWYWNRYPGVAVDIPSFSYQFSFAKHTDWTRVYAPGEELTRYADHCVALGCATRFGSAPASPRRGSTTSREAWELQTHDGETLTARHVIDATGVLTQPKLPDIEGLETFAGITMHTARWDPHHSLARSARRRDRHRRVRRSGDPGDGTRGAPPDRVSAHADLVPTEA